MTKLPFFFFFFFLLLLLFPLISGEIKTLKLSYDSRPLILVDHFRFTDTGHMTISVSSASATLAVGSPDLSRVGFFLLSEASSVPVVSALHSNYSLCPLDVNYVDRLFTFRDLNHSSSFNRSYAVTSPGEYFLYFQTCISGSVVSMELRTELYNLDERGSKDFVSSYLARWPLLYLGISAVYFVVLSLLVRVCVRNRSSVSGIHWLMGVVVVAKALSLIVEVAEMRYVMVTGTRPIGWDVLFDVLSIFGNAMLFAAIALLGAGCSFPKQSWEERAVGAVMAVVPLRIFADWGCVMSGETGPLDDGSVFYVLVSIIADMACCVAVVYPFLWTVESMAKRPEYDGGKATAKSLAKWTLFWQFFMVVIGYLLLTTIMFFVGLGGVLYKYKWVEYAAEETATLAFCGMVVYMFRPVEKNEYFVVDETKEQADEVAIRHEEIEV